MMRDPHSERRLERLVDRALKGQPSRRAPAALEARVLAEIERRASASWWRRGFTQWPGAARIAFVACSVGLAKFSISAVIWATAGTESLGLIPRAAPGLTAVRAAAQLLTLVGRAGASVIHAIPPEWLYGGVVLAAALYVGVFGLAAAAYRILYVRS